MKHWKRAAVYIFILLMSLPVAADDSHQRQDQNTRQFYQSLLDSAGLLGAALRVDGGGEYFNGTTGFANFDTLQRWKPDMPFYAGSIGKTFIAVVILQLWEENQLGLDDTLTRWLPEEITDNLPGSEKVTLRHLLNHTSGIIDVLNDIPDLVLAMAANPDRPWRDEDALPYAFGHQLYFEPGSQLRYSNTGYMLLAMVIERVTGEHASAAIRKRILEPLDMRHTYYQVYEDDGSNLVHGYTIGNGGWFDNRGWIRNIAFGAGAIATTTADLGRFFRAIFKNPRLLSKKSRREMLNNNFVTATSIESVGLGIAKTDWGNIVSYWYDGGISGYHSIVRYFPTHDLVVVGFVNQDFDDSPVQPAQVFNNRILSVVMARLSAKKQQHHTD